MAALFTFFNNIRYLFRYSLKTLSKQVNQVQHEFDNIHYSIEHIKFEIEDDLKHMKRFHIKNEQETINTLIHSNCSICRFGDGEINLIMGIDIPFQKASTFISQRLSHILSSQDDRILISIPNLFCSLSRGG